MDISSVVGNVIINIGCNFATDMIKSFGKRCLFRKIESELSQYLDEFVDLETDSGSFQKFLNSTENKVNFKEYIKYKAYKKITLEKEEVILTRDLFIKEVSTKAIMYVKHDISRNISYDVVRSYIDRLLQIIEEKLLNSLTIENLGTLYFLKQSLAEMEERLLENLNQTEVVLDIEGYEQVRNSYVKIIQRRSKTSHVYGIDELDMYSFYVFPKFVIENAKLKNSGKSSYIDWHEIFNESNIISVIGGAGFGKSLFLKNLINKHTDLKVFETGMLLPIYCDLKNYKTMSKGKHMFSIEDFLVQSMIDYTGMDERELNKDFLRYFLQSGRCLILFDALDEVEKGYREELNEKISSFFESSNQNNKVCITSRAAGFIPKTRITYRVNPINTEQANEYIDKMSSLNYFKKSDKSDFIDQCNILIKNGFLVSFLQLSLLVNIFKAEKELPENKIDLYEKCIEYISRKRERDQKKSNFNFKNINIILDNDGTFEKLSFLSRPNNSEENEYKIKELLLKRYKRSFLAENEALNAIDEFLKFCSERTELYVEGVKEGYYKFYHRSFFEFFYSKYLIKDYSNNNLLIEEILNYDIDSEIFDITSSLLKKYYDDRYIDFVEIIIDHIYKLDLTEEENKDQFLKYSLMLLPINEVEYLNKYYSFCFNENRILKLVDKRFNAKDNLLPIISKIKSTEDFVSDCIKFYKEEVISAHFFLSIDLHELDINVELSFLFGEMYHQLIRVIDFQELLKDYEVNHIIEILEANSKINYEKIEDLKIELSHVLSGSNRRRRRLKKSNRVLRSSIGTVKK